MTKKDNTQVVHALKTILAQVIHETNHKPLRPTNDDKNNEAEP